MTFDSLKISQQKVRSVVQNATQKKVYDLNKGKLKNSVNTNKESSSIVEPADAVGSDGGGTGTGKTEYYFPHIIFTRN